MRDKNVRGAYRSVNDTLSFNLIKNIFKINLNLLVNILKSMRDAADNLRARGQGQAMIEVGTKQLIRRI